MGKGWKGCLIPELHWYQELPTPSKAALTSNATGDTSYINPKNEQREIVRKKLYFMGRAEHPKGTTHVPVNCDPPNTPEPKGQDEGEMGN